MVKRILWLILMLAVFVQTAVADGKSDAGKVVRQTVDSCLDWLKEKDLSDDAKYDNIVTCITPVFDFALMGKLALGKKQWPRLDEAQRKEYTRLFIQQLQNSYARKIMLFSGETIEYEEPLQVKSKVHVGTSVVSTDGRNKILYKLYKSKTGWKVYDVEIKGVSIVSSYRAQYAEIMKTGTAETLLNRMKEKVNQDDEKKE
ncbi:MAG: ABC transporter substrate-binding protein [Verrucomicrobia bacterium]|jgi:phospholipid transport system substrate-binding protein|nr:ABC transporter substrate-binding protein [Verrucomicrobiota bacterium]MBT7067858.1 ABC transporter substrate-binding protein [Verrucomicrobiota bacterium]MBT7699861.1 ABC transporter substrate-binding protein [Verrucomicrobiota bacterium]